MKLYKKIKNICKVFWDYWIRPWGGPNNDK